MSADEVDWLMVGPFQKCDGEAAITGIEKGSIKQKVKQYKYISIHIWGLKQNCKQIRAKTSQDYLGVYFYRY